MANAKKSQADPDSRPVQPDRRRAIKRLTLAIGGAIGAVLVYPIARFVLFPVRRATVSSDDTPIDVAGVSELPASGDPVKVELVGEGARDSWGRSDRVALGAAWVRKTDDGSVEALSAVCPHLGCAIGYDSGAGEFRCPCHRSAFGMDGGKKSGPAKRGLDPLPVVVERGRVRVRFVRFKQDISERKPV